MKCPHCDEEIPGKTCPECGALTPGEAHYCMECGSLLEYTGETDSVEGEEIDFENRVLCPDGACTGIILDGSCTECGKPLVPTGSTEEEGEAAEA